MSIVLYGAGPVFPDRWPGLSPDPFEPAKRPRGVDLGGIGGIVIPQPAPPSPIAPDTVDDLRARLEVRRDWLKNELRMHASWKVELQAIERMIAAFPLRVGDRVRSEKAMNDGALVTVTRIGGDEGNQVFARWGSEDHDTWIDRRDVSLVERAEMPSESTVE